MKDFILKTERCYVREIRISDVDAVFELYDSPHMTDFIEPMNSYEEEVRYQQLYIEKIYGTYGYGMWAVFDRHTDRLIGEAGLGHRTDINRKKFPFDWMFDEHCAELGFCFAEDLWGQGYCTEVCRAILDYCHDTFDIRCAFARAEDENKGSVRVLQKLGFTKYEDTDHFYRVFL